MLGWFAAGRRLLMHEEFKISGYESPKFPDTCFPTWELIHVYLWKLGEVIFYYSTSLTLTVEGKGEHLPGDSLVCESKSVYWTWWAASVVVNMTVCCTHRATKPAGERVNWRSSLTSMAVTFTQPVIMD